MSSLSPLMRAQPHSNLHPTLIRYYLAPPETLKSNAFKKNISTHYPGHRVVRCGIRTTGGKGGKDGRDADMVYKLFDKVLNSAHDGLPAFIRDESNSVLKLGTFIALLQAKEQLSQMFSSLVAFVVNHIEFIIQPRMHGGTDLAIRWHFEWKGFHLPLGKDCSLNMGHIYYGKIVLKNASAIVHLLPNMEPFRSKLVGIVTALQEKIAPHDVLNGKRKVVVLYCSSLVLMALSLILLKQTFV